jgi:hypothetical protein
MQAIAIAIVFGITGWMLKSWLSHQEKMKGSRISEGQRYVTKLLNERAQAQLEPVRTDPTG